MASRGFLFGPLFRKSLSGTPGIYFQTKKAIYVNSAVSKLEKSVTTKVCQLDTIELTNF